MQTNLRCSGRLPSIHGHVKGFDVEITDAGGISNLFRKNMPLPTDGYLLSGALDPATV